MNIPKDLQTKVNEIIDEEDGSYFVWLNKGWAFDPCEDEAQASHCSGMFDNITEIRQAIKGASRCPCQWCAS
jgi:hypothetical protein